MKILTKNSEIVEGEAISEGLAKFVEDVNDGSTGVVMYGHQKKEIISYMVKNFDLVLKPQTVEIPVVEVEAVVYPEPKSLPLVETTEDGPSF